MTPIEYLEQRIETLRTEQPTSRSGRDALAHTLHELNNILMAFKIQAVHALQHAQKEAGIQ